MNDWIFQENFFLFGMGNRPKLIFKNHCLFDIQHQTVLACFDERQRAEIHPADYRVDIGKDAVWEDAHGLYLCQGNQVRTLSRENVHLPAFEPHPHAALMRVLHHDLLVSLVDGRPVPNPLVYQAPWYRDAAMMAMALQRTGIWTLYVTGFCRWMIHTTGTIRAKWKPITWARHCTLFPW